MKEIVQEVFKALIFALAEPIVEALRWAEV